MTKDPIVSFASFRIFRGIRVEIFHFFIGEDRWALRGRSPAKTVFCKIPEKNRKDFQEKRKLLWTWKEIYGIL